MRNCLKMNSGNFFIFFNKKTVLNSHLRLHNRDINDLLIKICFNFIIQKNIKKFM